jgi:anti-anti-sigma regulatory factor
MTLRITRARGSRSRARLRLEGSVVAEWADLLESECLDLLRSRGAVSLDLTGVRFVDQTGLAVFGRLSRAGVEIHCQSRLIASVLEGEGVRVTVDADGADEGRP